MAHELELEALRPDQISNQSQYYQFKFMCRELTTELSFSEANSDLTAPLHGFQGG
jgi:hypothetical protein